MVNSSLKCMTAVHTLNNMSPLFTVLTLKVTHFLIYCWPGHNYSIMKLCWRIFLFGTKGEGNKKSSEPTLLLENSV